MRPLVSPADLARRLENERPPMLLDIRSSVDGGGRAAFEAAHIPGSLHTDYVADSWRAVRGTAAGLLPDEAALSRLLGRFGLGTGDAVVVLPAGVSAGDFAAAARVYWTLKMAGLTEIAILDGGVAAWVAEGRPTEAGPGLEPAPTEFPVTLDPRWRATLPAVEAAVAAGGATLVDSRGPLSFVGQEKSGQVARAGRLPGAVLVEGARAFDPALNRLRPLPDLQALFAPVPVDVPAIAYCNTGHQAATDWFVLSELMGRPGITLYDGSLSEWAGDESRPVVTGPADPDGSAPPPAGAPA